MNTIGSNQEKLFEQELERSEQVGWWYKNGAASEKYFAIEYTDPQTGFQRLFYPDYIVQFRDGSLGIFDPKTGMTVTDPATAAKSDALQAYIASQKGRALRGGIVQYNSSGWLIYQKPQFSLKEDEWTRIINLNTDNGRN